MSVHVLGWRSKAGQEVAKGVSVPLHDITERELVLLYDNF